MAPRIGLLAVCLLALVLLAYNFSSYTTLMETASTSHFASSSSAERRKHASAAAAHRALRLQKAAVGVGAHALRTDAALPAADSEDDTAEEDDDENDEDNEGEEEESSTSAATVGSVAAKATTASTSEDDSASTALAHGAAIATSILGSVAGTANAAAAAVSSVTQRLQANLPGSHAACRPVAPDWTQRPLNYVAPTLESATWPVNCDSDPAVRAAGGTALCAKVAKAARHREVVVTLLDDSAEDGHASDASALAAFLAAAPAQVLVVTRGDGAKATATAAVASAAAAATADASYAHFHIDTLSAGPVAALPSLALKYAVVGAVLNTGCGVLFAHVTTTWRDGAHVFGYLSRDTDLEAVTGGGLLSTGRVVSVDDGIMGWSRYAQSLAISGLSPHLFYAAATHEAAALAAFLQLTFSRPDNPSVRGPEGTTRDEMYELTQEAFGPAHDAKRSAGVSVRILPPTCFAVGTHGSVASTTPSKSGGGGGGGGGGIASYFGGNTNEILSSRAFEARPQVLRQGCAKVPIAADSPPARPLNWVVPKSEPEWPKREACESLGVQGLCTVLKSVAREREVLAAVSNKNIFHMLQLFVNGIKAANISNAMVVSLDDATEAWCKDRSVPTYKKKLVSRTGSTDNHATSGLKFKILVDFLSVGASVLLSDVDVIWLADPFGFLYKDTDVEGMTDGWDEPTSYGYNYNGGGYRVFARNSGMFYLQATHESNQMMKRLARRMEREGTWDQVRPLAPLRDEQRPHPSHPHEPRNPIWPKTTGRGRWASDLVTSLPLLCSHWPVPHARRPPTMRSSSTRPTAPTPPSACRRVS